MHSYACAAPGCLETATLRQMGPVDPDHPLYLCVQHWSDLRILDPDRAALYGSIMVLGPVVDGQESGQSP